MDEGTELIVFFVIVFAVGCIAFGLGRDTMKLDAVKKGYAEYHPVTGEWQWKECELDAFLRELEEGME